MTDAVTHFQGGGDVDKWHGRRTERATWGNSPCYVYSNRWLDGWMAGWADGRMDGMVSSVCLPVEVPVGCAARCVFNPSPTCWEHTTTSPAHYGTLARASVLTSLASVV